jgi:hypothetical protein
VAGVFTALGLAFLLSDVVVRGRRARVLVAEWADECRRDW